MADTEGRVVWRVTCAMRATRFLLLQNEHNYENGLVCSRAFSIAIMHMYPSALPAISSACELMISAMNSSLKASRSLRHRRPPGKTTGLPCGVNGPPWALDGRRGCKAARLRAASSASLFCSLLSATTYERIQYRLKTQASSSFASVHMYINICRVDLAWFIDFY